jgi:hypothetical protein
LFQNRKLALASLMLATFFAAHAQPFQAVDAVLSPPAGAPPPLAIAPSSAPLIAENLPDDPSAFLQQSQPQNTSQDHPSQSQPADSSAAAQGQNPATPGQVTAEDQLKQQERHRVFGVMAAFNTTQNRNALPLSPGQKFQLFFKSQTDPWPFGLSAVIAGINQAENSPNEYGQGMQGYAKRFGATYTDSFIGNFFGNAVLTSWWHEDPRYFQKGTGSYTIRFLWAATGTVWCKRDNGTWGPNYANVAGNLIGAAIANVYYPQSERTVHDTIYRGLSVTAQGIIGSEVIEFWPDMVRHYERKHAAKLAKQAAQQDAQDAAKQKSSTPAAPANPTQP